jgi:ABC-type antimicrobial peptide transport system permease subunit
MMCQDRTLAIRLPFERAEVLAGQGPQTAVVFAVAALLLAAIGIYGVMSFSVAQRTHEIGLRMALGADRSHVLRLILREGLVLAVIGLGLGLLGGVLVGHAVHSVLYQVGTIDLPTLCGVAVLLLAAGLLASYLPARRATRVDPMVGATVRVTRTAAALRDTNVIQGR